MIFSFQRHLPLPQEPDLWPDWEYFYAHCIGCIGILKDWFTRTLAEVLEQGAPTLTRADLERHAWSLDQCEKMAQDALDGESVLTEVPEATERLRNLLGLGTKPGVEIRTSSGAASRTPAPSVPDRRRNPASRRVGSRKPVRDAVGMRGAG